jgi:hypothetical protein
MIQGKQIADASIAPGKLVLPYGAEFVYQPGGTPSGNVFADPWLLAAAIFSANVPSIVYVDCTFVSPAPWPVDTFLLNVAYAAAPVNAPAVLGLVTGTDPLGNPSDGTLWFPRSLDGVTVKNVNIADPAATMVTVGEIFGQAFTMKNGATIQRASDADILALFITGNPAFDLRIENCVDPFQNLGNPASTGNVKFFGAGGLPGRVLNLLLTVGGPSFVCNSFTAQVAGQIVNVRYDDTIPQAQTTQAAWAGPVNKIPLATAASEAYAPSVPGNWPVVPAFVGPALDELAANLAASTVTYDNRFDLSVNAARVDVAQGPSPILVTGTSVNAAGAFNGGGTGNKAILGFKGHSGLLLSGITSIQFDYEMISLNPGFVPQVNLVVDAGGGLYHIFVLDPSVAVSLNTGTITPLGGNKFRFTHLTASNYVQVVNAFSAPPIVGNPPGLVTPAMSVGPLWNQNSFKWGDITAVPAFSTWTLADANSGDGGLPKNAITPAMLIDLGDSGNVTTLAYKLGNILFNGAPA